MAKTKRAAPMKQCPKCGEARHARVRKCECGHEFAQKAPKKASKKAGPASLADAVKVERAALQARLGEVQALIDESKKLKGRIAKLDTFLKDYEK